MDEQFMRVQKSVTIGEFQLTYNEDATSRARVTCKAPRFDAINTRTSEAHVVTPGEFVQNVYVCVDDERESEMIVRLLRALAELCDSMQREF